MSVYTEANAKTHWCPFARAVTYKMAVNRTARGTIGDGTHCIGSECMAWRWGDLFSDSGGPFKHGEFGYCGLAGNP